LEKIASEHQVWFCNPTTDHEPPAAWLPQGVTWVRVSTPFQRDDLAGFENFAPQLRRTLEEIRPNLVHAGPAPTCGYAAALAGFHPLLVMSWGSDILLDANRDEQWKRATQTALSAADGFTCDCDAVRSAALSLTHLDNSRIAQFPWGVKLDVFTPQGPAAKLPWNPNETCTFLSTRSWEPLYAIDILLDAFRRAREKQPNLRLILLGAGSQSAMIRDFIAQNGLQYFVLLPGQTKSTDLPGWFRAASAYVSCARSDGTSVSLLEAMATGLPVIASNIPSNREWITEGVNGWLAQTDSPSDFAAKMLRAAQLTTSERAAIADRNRQIAEDRADWDRNFPRLLALYEQLAGVHSSP
jgi:glycosyltransferase involved in cell wall biosynthesis